LEVSLSILLVAVYWLRFIGCGLLVAEIVGLLYARALQQATDHPIAQAAAQQMEWDESQHLLMHNIC
jgi:hypothetical protein